MSKETKKIIDDSNDIFSSINKIFTEIYKKTMDTTAVLIVRPNKYGNPEFEAKTIGKNPDQLTGKSEGYTSTKVQCAAFILSVLSVYSLTNKNFYKFAYFDGLFEGWGDNPKKNFIEIIRDYCNKYHIQFIVSMIKSDMPLGFKFKKDEIIISLDENKTLFGFDF
jgi:uncharacterized protein YydD (DUF2326 family)